MATDDLRTTYCFGNLVPKLSLGTSEHKVPLNVPRVRCKKSGDGRGENLGTQEASVANMGLLLSGLLLILAPKV